MSWVAVRWAYEQETGSLAAKAVLVGIAFHADRSGFACPSQPLLARECEMSERTIREQIRALEAREMLRTERRKRANQSHASNGYQLLMLPAGGSGKSPETGSDYSPADDSGNYWLPAGASGYEAALPERGSSPTTFEPKDEQMKLPDADAAVSSDDIYRQAATAEMSADLLDRLDEINDQAAAKRLKASARGIISGDSRGSWMDPRDENCGGQIPWTERPTLFRLAIDKCLADQSFGSMSLHNALRYVIPQQLDPFPLHTSSTPRPGTPAGDYLAAHPGKDTDVQRRTRGSLSPISETEEQRAERESREAEEKAVDEWKQRNQTASQEMHESVRKELAEHPDWKDKSYFERSAKAYAICRERILELVGRRGAA